MVSSTVRALPLKGRTPQVGISNGEEHRHEIGKFVTAAKSLSRALLRNRMSGRTDEGFDPVIVGLALAFMHEELGPVVISRYPIIDGNKKDMLRH